MLTDDALTAELEAAFRGSTGHLTYSGRRRPRRAASVAPPLVAAALVVGTLVAVVHPWSGTAAPTVALPRATQSATPTAPASPRLVRDTVSLAGFSLTYERRPGQPDPLHAELRREGLPAGVRRVPLSGTAAKAWVGKDPRSGDNALFVKAPTRNGGRLFALLSSTWTQQQLVRLFRSGEPRTVPLTKG